MNYLEITNIVFSILCAVLGYFTVSYIFTPAFNFSKIVRNNGLDYFEHIVKCFLYRFFAVLLLVIISGFFIPLVWCLDVIIFSIFKVDLNIDFRVLLLFLLTLFVFLNNFLVLLNERKKVKNGELIPFDISTVGLNNSEFIFNDLDIFKNVKFYALRSDELTAYTYASFFGRARIVISERLLVDGWSGPLRSVLMHEYNHIQRFDIYFSMILSTFSSCILGTLRFFEFILSPLKYIPFINIIYVLLMKLLHGVALLWSIIENIVLLTFRKSEIIADLESKGHSDFVNLIIALRDVIDGHVGHYHFTNNYEIAEEIVRERLIRPNYKFPSFFTQLKSIITNSDSHPPVEDRFYWAMIFSDFNVKDLQRHNGRPLVVTVIFFLFFICIYGLYLNVVQSKNYEITNQELKEYIKYLRE